MILRVAHFRVQPDDAMACAAGAQALFGRVRRTDGLAWSTVGQQTDGDAITIIAVSLWRDRASLAAALGPETGGRTEAEEREGLPAASPLEVADVVEDVGPAAAIAPIDPLIGRRRRGLLPQDRELLRILCGGRTLAEAATLLGVSVGTAKNRRHEIYEKLGVHDLGAACTIAASDIASDLDARAS